MGAILQYGLSVALVGIGTVFVGLIILIALIKLMEIVMASATGKKKAAAPAPAAPAPVAPPTTPPAAKVTGIGGVKPIIDDGVTLHLAPRFFTDPRVSSGKVITTAGCTGAGEALADCATSKPLSSIRTGT